MHETDTFRHWNVTLQSGKEVYVVSPEACDNTLALFCANDWVRSKYPGRFNNDNAIKVVGFNDRFEFNGLVVERHCAKTWYRIDTTPISDGDMRTLVEELCTILTKHFDDFGEMEVNEYIEDCTVHYDIEEQRERLEKELLLEYGGVPF